MEISRSDGRGSPVISRRDGWPDAGLLRRSMQVPILDIKCQVHQSIKIVWQLVGSDLILDFIIQPLQKFRAQSPLVLITGSCQGLELNLSRPKWKDALSPWADWLNSLIISR